MPFRVFSRAALAAVAALAVGAPGCSRRDAAPASGAFRFVDHLDEARIEGALPGEEARETAVYEHSMEAGALPALRPFVGFEPPPEAGEGARAAWRAARTALAGALSAGADERVRGSRGLAIAAPTGAQFSGLRTAPIPIEPGATYRAEVFLRADGLALPDPEVGATLLVFGLALGRDRDAGADARLDDEVYFSNRAVLLEELAPAPIRAGTTAWERVSVVVKTSRRVDHVLVAAVMHGPQPPGARAGGVRFDDLAVYKLVPAAASAPALADHFTGAPHAMKRKLRIVTEREPAGAGAAAEGTSGAAAAAGASETTWNAILAPAPGRIAFDVRVPERARLGFALAVPPAVAGESGSVTFAIDVRARGRETRVFERTMRPSVEEATREWSHATADLAAFAGQGVTITFVTEREAGGGITVAAWGEPVMYTAPPGSEGPPAADGGSAPASREAGSASDSGPPGVLLVSIDTLRRDRLGCYGSPRRVTPEIDALARAGLVFETSVSASSWTLPSHVSMLAGIAPSLHRATGDERRLGASRVTAPELLRRAGFATGAFVTHYYVSGDYGLDRGFESFSYEQERPAADVCESAAAWIAAHSARPFFCFVHLFDPHWDYPPPHPYLGVAGGRAALDYDGAVTGAFDPLQPWIDPRTPVAARDLAHLLDLYDGEIAAVDAALGRLFAALDEIGVAGRTLVVVTSDHGEEFRDHDSFGHGHTLYDEVVRVPLVVRAPGAARGASHDGGAARGAGGGIRTDASATIDIAPTLLGFAGVTRERIDSWIAEERDRITLSSPDGAGDAGAVVWEPEGVDLLGARGAAAGTSGAAAGAGEPRVILSETERFGSWRIALRRDEIKFLTPARYLWWRTFTRGPEIYDVRRDPGERENLVGAASGQRGLALGEMAVRLLLERHRGIAIVFRGDASAHRSAQARIEGARLLDPTGIGLEPADHAAKEGTTIDVSMDLAPGDLDVLLLRAEHGEGTRLLFGWDGGRPPAGILVAGPERRPVAKLPLDLTPGTPAFAALGPADASAMRAWPGPGIWVLASEEEAGTSFALDEEEIERLRALGYIE
jgi:arylsulfatase A-like enzyme